jgi:Putative peptidoglycan binding domain
LTATPGSNLSSKDNLEVFLSKALSYPGHRAMANMVSGFGEKVGYGSNPWSGAFIDVVTREAGLTTRNVPAMVYTPQALAEFARRNTLYQRPKPGDIAFFAFAGEGARTMFDMPHVGIVTDTSRFSATGLFQVLEAQTSTGLPRGNQDPSGVYLRVRSAQDVIGFGRPDFRPERSLSFSNKLKVSSSDSLPLLTTAHLTTGRPNRATETLQLALSRQVQLAGYLSGTFDPATRAALAHYQRTLGRIGSDATGSPDAATLACLARDTGLFRVG